HHQRDLREQECSGCGDGGSATCLCRRAARRPRGNCRKPTADCQGAHKREGRRASHPAKRAGGKGFDGESRDCAAGSSNEPAGGGEADAASAASAVCKTAAGPGSTSRRAFGEARDPELASSRGRGCAPDGQAGASWQTGDADHRPSRQPAQCWPPGTAHSAARSDESSTGSATAEGSATDESPSGSAAAESSGAARSTTAESSTGSAAAESSGAARSTTAESPPGSAAAESSGAARSTTAESSAGSAAAESPGAAC